MLSFCAEPRQQPSFKSTGACLWSAGGTRLDELPLLFFSLTCEASWPEIGIARYSVSTKQSSFKSESGAGWPAHTTRGACMPSSTFSAASGG
uniref:Macaca fascicularis brain cDNA clone: QflA-19151, similar to human myosin VA (heavy polypeptide 12, myoxin) (MYO5A), mRNA, RefSeq: NM_000259.1 n=1 Tax=Macaca fascicularis TaxID=9541 RepID=I7GID7_MACFA|nr:unnamed protein product [Macaca fascicularis]